MNFKQWLESVGIIGSVPEALSTLGLKPGASKEEIAKAFRAMSMRHHSDVGGSDTIQKRLNAAFDLLKSRDFQTAGGRGPEWNPPEPPRWDGSNGPGARWAAYQQRRNNDLPPWQTDERSSNNSVGGSRKNINYCLKEIYEKAMENGGNVKKYTFDAFDGRFFRGIFTAYCNPQTLGFAGEVMDDWNSKGANSYETYAVLASRDNSALLVRLRGKDVSNMHMGWEFSNEDRNSEHWRREFKKELDEIQ
ncbi:MAG: J domain-containing protein [Proteobacteria bacterium]|jgi:hypothetical protein|nr:J domain-containing protein [Pseudomonadota bacterium]